MKHTIGMVATLVTLLVGVTQDAISQVNIREVLITEETVTSMSTEYLQQVYQGVNQQIEIPDNPWKDAWIMKAWIVYNELERRAGNVAAAAEEPVTTVVGESFILQYEPPDETLAPYANLLMESGVMEEVVTDLENTFQLPQPILIRFTSGKPGPLYYQGVINMTYEFLLSNHEIIAATGYAETEDELVLTLLNLVEFVLYHEVGHALVDMLDLPVLGKEEDAVDGFAAVVASAFDLDVVALTAADIFNLNTSIQVSNEISPAAFWDSHSLDQQRMYSIICMIYGSDPNGYSSLLNDVGMPSEKESECVYSFQEISRNWIRLIADYIKQ